jgi:hypothetical protein
MQIHEGRSQVNNTARTESMQSGHRGRAGAMHAIDAVVPCLPPLLRPVCPLLLLFVCCRWAD